MCIEKMYRGIVLSVTLSCTTYKEIKVNYVSAITGRCFLSFVWASLAHSDGNICVYLGTN